MTLAITFSGLATFVVYLLARAIYDRPAALAAATLLAVSPLCWFYGSVGLTYAGEALVRLDRRVFRLRALNGSEPDAWLAAAAISAWPAASGSRCCSCSFRCGWSRWWSVCAGRGRCWSGC